MSDPGLNGVEKWWDGKGNPLESAQYLKAVELRDRPGLSEAARDRLTDAIKHYEFITHPAGVADEPAASTPHETVLPEVKIEGDPNAPTPELPKPKVPWYESLLRGAGQGATLRFGDEAASWLVPESGASPTARKLLNLLGTDLPAADESGIPRQYAEGSARDSMLAQMRRDNDEARRAHGFAYGAGEVAGSTPLAVLAGEALPAGAGLGARTAYNAATGAGFAGTMAKGSGADNAEAAKQALMGALISGGLTSTIGGVRGALASRAAKAEQAAQDALDTTFETGNAADAQRLRAAGATLPQIRTMQSRAAIGEELPLNRYASAVEELRASRGSRFIPKSKTFYGREADRALESADAAKSLLESDLKDVPISTDALASSIRGGKSHYSPSEGAPFRQALEDKAQMYEAMADGPQETIQTTIAPSGKLTRGSSGQFAKAQPIPLTIDVAQEPTIPFARARDELSELGSQSKWDALNQSPVQQVRSRAYGALNEGIENELNAERPGAGTNWRALKENVHRFKRISDVARDRELRDATNRVISPTDYLVAGSELAANNPKTGLVMAGLHHLLRGREHDIAASILRTQSERAANSAMNAAMRADRLRALLPTVGEPLERAAMTPAFTAGAVGAANAAAPNSEPPMPEPREQLEPPPARIAPADQIASNTRGQMLPDVAKQLYQADPAAFGPYASNIFNAMRKGEGQLAAELSRLEQDPTFARTVLPRLRAMTANE